jgi:pyruvate dehydrogenase E2 component (dihydrolipoamide acetyltransferase)
MEALSPTMEEGQLVQWLKSEGDDITAGDILAEIETDKATMELIARGDGTLRKIFLGAGGTADVGAVIAVIAAADEDISGIEGASGGNGATPAAAELAKAEVEAAAAPAPAPAPTAPAPAAPSADGGRVKASPLARRLAEEMGVDIGTVAGSGPGGRVVKRDIEAARAAGPSAHAAPTWTADETEYEDIPTSQMRKTIAKRLITSIGPVPTFYLTNDVDMGRVIEARKSINTMLERDGLKVSINDIVLKAVAAALRQHPNCNAQWQDGFVRRFNAVHIGVAVAIDDGLITPVVRNAHLKGIKQKPVVVDGEIVVRSRMRITMSCDHRVIDGAQGARYLATLKAMLEEPTAILL